MFLLLPTWRIKPDDKQEQIKWLHFGRNWNRNKGSEYKKKFESMSICFNLPLSQTSADA